MFEVVCKIMAQGDKSTKKRRIESSMCFNMLVCHKSDASLIQKNRLGCCVVKQGTEQRISTSHSKKSLRTLHCKTGYRAEHFDVSFKKIVKDVAYPISIGSRDCRTFGPLQASDEQPNRRNQEAPSYAHRVPRCDEE